MPKLGNKNALNHRCSPEVRKLLSQQKLGNKNALGHLVSESARKLISQRTRESMANPYTRRKLSIRALNRRNTPESNLKRSIALKGCVPWHKGLRGIKTSDKGQVPWNRGLTQETDERVAKCANSMRGRAVPSERRQKISASVRKWWGSLLPQTKSELMRKFRESMNLRPNKLEQKIQELLDIAFPDEWRYTGDGSLIIGGKIPDYANVNGHKALIEAFGDYWHQGENPQDRIDVFAEFGYRTLVIWEHELGDKDNVVTRVRRFMESRKGVTNGKEKVWT